ncbi:EF-hand [Lichtheimia hyalospora FSU 10163]|nr:EF-hand [Lichtheimia hyalospora FSU 10163]
MSSSFGNKRASFGMHFMSNNKKQQLYDLFNTFDKDKDGKVSVSEMKELLDQTGVNTDAVAHMLNKKPNDTVDFDEFALVFKSTVGSAPRCFPEQHQELRDAFDVFDKNQDGVISAEELCAMMHQLGEKITLQEAENMIAEVDKDNDGVVNFEEFLHMMGVRKKSTRNDQAKSTSASTSKKHKRLSQFKKLLFH